MNTKTSTDQARMINHDFPAGNSNDLVTLVNESDEVIGSMDKVEAHRGEGKLHRAVSVYLFNSEGELLIQQRSAKKIVGAHQWANTICGNVRPSENYEECAYRRLKEELGITGAKINDVYHFQYHLKCGVLTVAAKATLEHSTSRKLRDNEEFSEYELDHVFFGRYDGEVTPNPDEAQEFAWVDLESLILNLKSPVEKDEFGVVTISSLPTTYNLSPTTKLAPWFVWMLRDRQLLEIINNSIRKDTYANSRA